MPRLGHFADRALHAVGLRPYKTPSVDFLIVGGGGCDG
jgi:hypothetical protein